VAKWRKRPSVLAARIGPEPVSTVLSAEQEAIAVAFRRHTLLLLVDCLYALQATIPHLSRSALHRCFQRHGISRLPLSEDGQSPRKKKFKGYLIGYLHVDFAEVQTEEGRQYRPKTCDAFSWPSTAPVRWRLPSCIRGPNGSSQPNSCVGY